MNTNRKTFSLEYGKNCRLCVEKEDFIKSLGPAARIVRIVRVPRNRGRCHLVSLLSIGLPDLIRYRLFRNAPQRKVHKASRFFTGRGDFSLYICVFRLRLG